MDFKAYSFATSGLVKARAGLTRRLHLEGELKLQAQHHTNAIKADIVLKKQLAEMTQKPTKRRRV